MSESIRLLIWDLDETFWRGTLTEGGIQEYVRAHHDIVIALSRRGIINSICSKNDLAAVEKILKEEGLWEYFVFPSVDWSAKGPRVAQIIEAAQLRPVSVAFVDDNPSVRAEVAAHVPGLRVHDVDLLEGLLENPLFQGKDDSGLSRLTHYRLLEQRAATRARSGHDANAFLRESHIEVTIEHDLSNKLPRVIELINRTNQLNFTKIRLSDDFNLARAELAVDLDRHDARAGLVSVRDRFGDYGYCGFFLFVGAWGHTHTRHFVFSCRILGMGVEQWVYETLGRPEIHVQGEVVSELNWIPDWINLKDGAPSADDPTSIFPPAVRLRGGCELEVLQPFFRANAKDVTTELLVAAGKLSGSVLRNSSALLQLAGAELREGDHDILKSVDIDANDLRSRLFDRIVDRGLIIFSPSGDTASLYRHRERDFVVPIFVHGMGILSRRSDAEIESGMEALNWPTARRDAVRAMRAILTRDFTALRGDDEADLKPIYAAIVAKAPSNALMIVLLPSSMKKFGDKVTEDKFQKRRNDWFKDAATNNVNVRCLDITDLINPSSDVQDAYGHLSRTAYHKLYAVIMAVYGEWVASQPCLSLLPHALVEEIARA
jgi:FkbH-like protein